MPFLAPAIPAIVGGLGGFFLGKKSSSQPSTDPYAALSGKLDPILQSNQQIREQTTASGLANTASARESYDYVNNFLKSILTGPDENLMKMLDVSGATKNIDENEQLLSELGVRGGRRAAELGQASFDRDAILSTVLKQLRFSAPQQIANVAQAVGNLGLGELSAAGGAGAQASNILFGVEGLKQQDKDRRNALLSSIFGAVGGAAGAWLGSR